MHFDPKRVPQGLIDQLKPKLQEIVAYALSSTATLPGEASINYVRYHEDLITSAKDIFVRQQAAHETDVNPAPIEIEVQARRSKNRNPDIVTRLREDLIGRLKFFPQELLGHGQTCVWLIFNEVNDFRFVRLLQ